MSLKAALARAKAINASSNDVAEKPPALPPCDAGNHTVGPSASTEATLAVADSAQSALVATHCDTSVEPPQAVVASSGADETDPTESSAAIRLAYPVGNRSDTAPTQGTTEQPAIVHQQPTCVDIMLNKRLRQVEVPAELRRVDLSETGGAGHTRILADAEPPKKRSRVAEFVKKVKSGGASFI